MNYLRKKSISILLIIFIMVFSIINVYAFSIPPAPDIDIYVQDYANIISNDIREDMLRMSYLLKEKTTAELVVVTVNSLENRSIEEYALQLFRQWGIGSSDKNNGVLLLVAPQEREVRIEVGYGLEGAINDGKAGAILDEMIPYFRSEDYSTGIAVAYSLLVHEIGREYDIDTTELFNNIANINPVSLPEPLTLAEVIFLFLFLFFTIVIFMIIFSIIFRRNLFFLFFVLWRDLKSGRYAGHTSRHFKNRNNFPRGPFGGGGFGGGGFGGGSSGGGGASRKW